MTAAPLCRVRPRRRGRHALAAAVVALTLAACSSPTALDDETAVGEHTTSSSNHTTSSGNLGPRGR